MIRKGIAELSAILFSSAESGEDEAYALIRALLDASTDAIFLKDLRGRYLLINSAGARMLDRKVEDILYHDDFALFPRETAERIRAKDLEIVARCTTCSEEEEGMTGGVSRTWSTLKTPLRNRDGEVVGVLGIARDITGYKRVEEDLRRSNAELRVAQARAISMTRLETIGEVSASFAHEVRNPLGAIVNVSSLLQGCVPSSDDLARLLDIGREECAHLEHLVTELLNFARPLQVLLEEGSLRAVLERALASCGAAFPDSPVVSRLDIDDDVQLSMDAELLHQALLHLFQNAFQAMPTGGTLTVRLADPGPENAADYVQIEVCDTGPGLPPGSEARLFEPFFTTRAQGTGLGLPVARRIIGDHGGSVTFSSTPGAGTTFRIQLPRANGSGPTVLP